MLERQILHYLYRGYPFSVVVTFFLGLLEVSVVSNEVNSQTAFVWLAILSAVLFLRVLDYLNYLVINKGEIWSVRNMFRNFRLGILLTGLVWGSFPVLMAGSVDLSEMVFMAFVFAGITSGATTSVGVDRISTVVYLFTTLVPMLAWFLSVGEYMTGVMGVMIFFFAIFLYASSSRLRNQLISNVTLREEALENQAILGRRQKLTEMIVRLQAARIEHTDMAGAVEKLLEEIIQLSESNSGFIAEVATDEQNQLDCRILANPNNLDLGFVTETLEPDRLASNRINRLDGIYSRAMVTGKAQFTPDIEFFQGSPKVLQYASMLCLPVHAGNRVVAVIGLFSQSRTLDGKTAEFLNPLMQSPGHLFASRQDHIRNGG